MTQQEFTQRTGFYPTADQFNAINELYMESDKDKDAFCKEWKHNGGVEEYSKATALEIANLRGEITNTKTDLYDQIVRAYGIAEDWRKDYQEANKRIKELEAELNKWKGVVENIRMSIPQE